MRLLSIEQRQTYEEAAKLAEVDGNEIDYIMNSLYYYSLAFIVHPYHKSDVTSYGAYAWFLQRQNPIKHFLLSCYVSRGYSHSYIESGAFGDMIVATWKFGFSPEYVTTPVRRLFDKLLCGKLLFWVYKIEYLEYWLTRDPHFDNILPFLIILFPPLSLHTIVYLFLKFYNTSWSEPETHYPLYLVIRPPLMPLKVCRSGDTH